MNIPSDLKYSKEHEWIRLEGEVAYIGITDFAQGELGDLVYIDIDTVGQIVEINEIFGTVEAVKTTSDLFMPISGKVLEVNEKIIDSGENNPALINNDPYGNGWIIKIELTNPQQLDSLYNAIEYASLIGQ